MVKCPLCTYKNTYQNRRCEIVSGFEDAIVSGFDRVSVSLWCFRLVWSYFPVCFAFLFFYALPHTMLRVSPIFVFLFRLFCPMCASHKCTRRANSLCVFRDRFRFEDTTKMTLIGVTSDRADLAGDPT